ncbi:glycosyltransferase family 4 protein [Anseongella ginsenosidimutans]|nr:glycosyltransferase family 4 protein [Anseongella ginsenosidimutans]
MKRFFFPFGVLAMKQLHLKGYDVVLQSTTHCAKYIKTDPGTLIITYCHTPFRLAWSPDSYEKMIGSNFIKRTLYQLVTGILREIDMRAASKTKWFLTNAQVVVPRIKEAYKPSNDIFVINPPVKCRNFHVTDKPGNYYLVVSRFEPYKKVDLVIEAFNEMPDKELVIVGKGTMEKQLKKIAGSNIRFLSGLSSRQLAEVFAGCKALIFPQLEDYGITPLEANAAGRPVIAYGKGGVMDTMIPAAGDASKATAVFFPEQTVEALKSAMEVFEELTFTPAFIRAHAESFDEKNFVDRIRKFVLEKYNLEVADKVQYV